MNTNIINHLKPNNNDFSQICSIKKFLAPAECNKFISEGEKKGFKKSAPSGGGHGRTGEEAPRTSQFSVFDNEEWALSLWKKLQKHLPENLSYIPLSSLTPYVSTESESKQWYPIGVNPHIRLYKYDVGERIPKHMDYRMARDVWRDQNKYKQMTFTTLLIYLNDDFEEGQTGYWFDFDTGDLGTNRKRNCNFGTGCDVTYVDHDIVVEPEVGRALITDHCLFHEGLPPKKGTKYILRTDIIYEKLQPIHPTVRSQLSKKELEDHNGEWERIFETSCKNYAD